jgi:hypothetical protein
MNAQEKDRFDFLRNGPCVPFQYVPDYYGLSWPLPDELRQDFESWQSQLRRPVSCADGTVSRYDLESFMQRKSVIPKKWMGAQLGMTLASLDELLPRLKEIGMHVQRYVVYPDLIAQSLSEDLVPNLPGLRFRTFSDHNSFCLRLHADIAKTLGIKAQPLFCATSDRLQDYPRQFASQFDCITLAPLSGKHQMWLDFRKPLNLGPDRCSKLLYVENREAIRPFCAGTHEPDDLDGYIQFLEGKHNG